MKFSTRRPEPNQELRTTASPGFNGIKVRTIYKSDGTTPATPLAGEIRDLIVVCANSNTEISLGQALFGAMGFYGVKTFNDDIKVAIGKSVWTRKINPYSTGGPGTLEIGGVLQVNSVINGLAGLNIAYDANFRNAINAVGNITTQASLISNGLTVTGAALTTTLDVASTSVFHDTVSIDAGKQLKVTYINPYSTVGPGTLVIGGVLRSMSTIIGNAGLDIAYSATFRDIVTATGTITTHGNLVVDGVSTLTGVVTAAAGISSNGNIVANNRGIFTKDSGGTVVGSIDQSGAIYGKTINVANWLWTDPATSTIYTYGKALNAGAVSASSLAISTTAGITGAGAISGTSLTVNNGMIVVKDNNGTVDASISSQGAGFMRSLRVTADGGLASGTVILDVQTANGASLAAIDIDGRIRAKSYAVDGASNLAYWRNDGLLQTQNVVTSTLRIKNLASSTDAATIDLDGNAVVASLKSGTSREMYSDSADSTGMLATFIQWSPPTIQCFDGTNWVSTALAGSSNAIVSATIKRSETQIRQRTASGAYVISPGQWVYEVKASIHIPSMTAITNGRGIGVNNIDLTDLLHGTATNIRIIPGSGNGFIRENNNNELWTLIDAGVDEWGNGLAVWTKGAQLTNGGKYLSLGLRRTPTGSNGFEGPLYAELSCMVLIDF